MTNLLFGLAAACAITYLPMASRPANGLRSMLKTAAVVLLATIAVINGSGPLLVLALALCAVGDALLSRDTDTAFTAGVGAFAAGHIAYIALFLSQPASSLELVLDRPGYFWSLIILGIVAATLIAPRAGDLRPAVFAYIPITLGMGIAALTLPESGTLRWALPAAAGFIASDLILATEKFLLPGDHPAQKLTPYLVWVLYWGAQAGLLIAFV